eukprot:GFKZ01015330.1.p1 GENE.GFKZ01015330.1~~GFKZ01015330.1.p1  ORF type:complete len:322 (-),score=30.92 GFKZ01015330.1:957-1880(-)
MSSPQAPQTPSLSRRRSRHELRLEQIAIWGDAAAAYNTGRRSSFQHPATSPTSTRKLHTAASQPLDLDDLLDPGYTATLPLNDMRSGSLSMCHSRSAEVFRRSGKHGAVVRASLRGRDTLTGRESSGGGRGRRSGHGEHEPREGEAEEEEDPDADDMDGGRVVIRKGGMLGKGGGYRVERHGGSVGNSADGNKGIRRGRRGVRGRRESRENGNQGSTGSWMRRGRENAELRERDENDFRLSNAKLPERREDGDKTRGEWGKFKRGRGSVPILGRYTRSRSSQLPGMGGRRGGTGETRERRGGGGSGG